MTARAVPTRRLVRRRFAGAMVAVCIVLSVAAAFLSSLSTIPAGIAAWVAGLALWPDVARRVRVQGLALVAVGGAGLLWALPQGATMPWTTALSGNALLLAMLAAVSFLRLVATPARGGSVTAGSGRHRVVSSLFGLHLLGAVINISAVVIMAGRMALERRLDGRQVRVLTRGFSAAAYWSPFFAAMAAALTYAPDARLGSLVSVGLPLALLALMLTVREVWRDDPETFRGYPMGWRDLALPTLLAVLILVLHGVWPDLSILGLIALLAPLVTAMLLAAWRARPVNTLARHVGGGLPLMCNEFVLFLGAGFMASGLSAAFSSLDGWAPFATFGAPQASLLLVVMVLVSVVGVHPVISIAAAATLLQPLAPDHDLLAMAFLAAWSIGMVVSPLSGLTLTLQGAFNVRPLDVLRWNWRFGLVMTVAACLAMNAHDWLT